ncbi:arsenate reductase (glutaredoxin) [Allohahella marinimesophila]|uniref:Arsenate reductase n=1 Tax=Allohahella marinimesophila TaxID=1054972 RepID=A0ABP7NRE3_9GAMM
MPHQRRTFAFCVAQVHAEFMTEQLNQSGVKAAAVYTMPLLKLARITMPVALTLYHNPRCSKSRQALSLLEERGIDVNVVRYLDEPLTPEQLKALIDRLGCTPRDLLRKGEAEYTELGLGIPDISNDVLIEAMSSHPRLMERPILDTGEKAVVGRPPEMVLKLVES